MSSSRHSCLWLFLVLVLIGACPAHALDSLAFRELWSRVQELQDDEVTRAFKLLADRGVLRVASVEPVTAEVQQAADAQIAAIRKLYADFDSSLHAYLYSTTSLSSVRRSRLDEATVSLAEAGARLKALDELLKRTPATAPGRTAIQDRFYALSSEYLVAYQKFKAATAR